MTVREQLQQEASTLSEDMAQRVLDFLHSQAGGESISDSGEAAHMDQFSAYWSQWYGRCQNEEWAVPAVQLMEVREEW